MTFRERINNEKDNLTKIVLYNDKGLFYNLVERSAYAFCTRIRPFKVHVKTLKGLNAPYVSIGVPVAKKDVYLQGLTATFDDNGNVTALLKEPINEIAFQTWKKHIIEQKEEENIDNMASHMESPNNTCKDTPTQEVSKGNCSKSNISNGHIHDITPVIRQCLKEIKELNIASMTPMQTMLFLNKLQQSLKDVNI